MIFNNKKFAKDLKSIRQDLGVGVRGLKGLNVSHSTISRLENGKLPDILTYAKICRWMEKPLETYFK
jgi:transcriptional regulator with XRE-family HTH domain